MKLISLFFRTSPRTMITAVLFGLLSGAVSMYLIAQVNAALSGGLALGFAGFVVWVFVRFFTRVAAAVQLFTLSQEASHNLRLTLARRLLATPLRKLEEIGPAKALGSLTQDVESLALGGAAVAVIFIQGGFIVAGVVYLASLSIVSLALTCGFIGVAAIVNFVAGRITFLHFFRLSRMDSDEMFEAFRGITDGAKELKLHPARREAFLVERLEVPSERYCRRHRNGSASLAFAEEWSATVVFLVLGFLLLLWPHYASVSQATLSAYVLTILYLQASLDGLLGWLPRLAQAGVALEKMESLGLSLSTELDALGTAPPREWKRIELRGVTHTYASDEDERRFTLGPIDTDLSPGEIVFIVGANGSGKSTLAKVLVGLYAPERGEIVVDGTKVADEDRGSYRQRFSAVFSDWFLFDKIFGIEDVDGQAQRYVKDLRLAGKVSIEGGSLSTTALSQGQRKRLMLLIAYLENRPIYLFDEWAADQDPMFKEIFYREILPALKARGKTAVVITHDDRYFDVADRTIWLESGKQVTDLGAFPRRAAAVGA